MREQIIEALRTVYDPELPVNIYDMGLIYNIGVDAEGEVVIEMTLSSPGCPVGPLIEKMVKFAVSKIEGVKSVAVDVVWEPPWNPDMATEEARLEMGMF